MFKHFFLLTFLLCSLVLSGCGASVSLEEPGDGNTEQEQDSGNTGSDPEIETPETETETAPENNATLWTLAPSSSFINFVSTKKIHVVESHRFDSLDGIVDSDGLALLQISLDSVNTGVALRDQRMRDLFFETSDYPIAEITTQVDLSRLEALSVGEQHADNYQVNLNLHGLTMTLDVPLSVRRLSESQTLVRSEKPVLLNALDFNFSQGLAELQSLANLSSISQVVPVDLFLVFDRAEQE